jgi:hypothetical protein
MRLRKPAFATSFKPEPQVRHDSRVLTGFGGLVLFSAYLRASGFVSKLREQTREVSVASVFPLFSMLLLLVLFLAVGGRRQAHLVYFLHDGLLARLAWLKRLPSAATLSRFFSACKAPLVALVAELSAQLVLGCARRLGVTDAITLDLDGTVVSTRGHQERTSSRRADDRPSPGQLRQDVRGRGFTGGQLHREQLSGHRRRTACGWLPVLPGLRLAGEP